MVLGITGKYCSGKSTLTKLFVSKGFTEIDVDKIGHEALETLQEDVVKSFSFADILDSKGSKIDRKKLGTLVFSNKNYLKQLEGLVHPWMKQKIKKTITQQTNLKFVITAALLQKMQLHTFCDCVIVLNTPLLLRVIRAHKRDGLSLLQIIQRIYFQRAIINKKTLKTYPKPSEVLYVKGRHSFNERMFEHLLHNM